MQLTLANLVKKWLKERKDDPRFKDWTVDAYENYSQHDISSVDQAPNLRCWNPQYKSLPGKYQVAEEFICGPYGIMLQATDPKFFTKLARVIEFLNKRDKRYNKVISEFEKSERQLLSDMIGK